MATFTFSVGTSSTSDNVSPYTSRYSSMAASRSETRIATWSSPVMAPPTGRHLHRFVVRPSTRADALDRQHLERTEQPDRVHLRSTAEHDMRRIGDGLIERRVHRDPLVTAPDLHPCM